MTFLSSPWAIDGAIIGSSLARLAQYAATGSAEGVVNRADLKVVPLDVPGVGLKVNGGGALILNRYQSKVSQTYVVLNNDAHTLGPSEMPGANPSAQHYLVCVTVGDPEFSQVGHPWMTSEDPPEGEETTFDYVRIHLVACPNGTKSFAELNLDYPAYALARLEVPANTTTITSDMIHDLRELARPRSMLVQEHVPTVGDNLLNGNGGNPGSYERWPNRSVVTVKLPYWASTAKVTGFVEGARHTKAFLARLRPYIEGDGRAGTVTNINESAPTSGSDRKSYNLSGKIDVSDLATQTVTFSIQGTPVNEASKGGLDTDSNTSLGLTVYIEEAPI